MIITVDTDIEYAVVPDEDLLAEVARLSGARQAVEVALGAALVEVDARRLHREHGYRSAADMAAHTSALTLGDSRGLGRLAAEIEAWPEVAAAWKDQRLTTAHAKLVVRFLKKYWSRVPALGRDAVIAALLLAGADPVTARVTDDIKALTEHVTGPEDGIEDADNDELDTLEMRLTPAGRGVGSFDLHQEAAELLWAAVNALNTPRPEPDGTPDARSVGKRNADAFTELLRRCCDSGRLPEDGGERPHVHLLMDLHDLPTTADPDGTESPYRGFGFEDYDLFQRYADWVADLNADHDPTDHHHRDGGDLDADPTLDFDTTDTETTTGRRAGGAVNLDTDTDTNSGGGVDPDGQTASGCNHNHHGRGAAEASDGVAGEKWSRATDREFGRVGLSLEQRRAMLEAAMVTALLRRHRRPSLRWSGTITKAMARRVLCSADWTLVVTKNGRPIGPGPP